MRRGTVFGLFLALVALAGGCDDPVSPPTQLTVGPSPLTLGLGESTNLTATVRDQDGTSVVALTEWSSSAPAVVSVTAGFITGLQPGTAEITATAAGLSGTATVHVLDRVAPTVTIVSPVSESTVDGLVTIVARVSDDHSIERVSLSVDGVEVDSSEPGAGTSITANLTWDASAAADGTHVLVVAASDSTGNIEDASISLNVDVDTPPFVLSITGIVTSSGYNTATQMEECTSVITATAAGGAERARAEWLSGLVEYRNVNGLVMSADTLDAGDLLDYFGSSHIATGATQVVNRIDRRIRNDTFDVNYRFRAALPDSTLSSIDVFLNCY